MNRTTSRATAHARPSAYVPNPFHGLKQKTRSAAIVNGVIRTAQRLGRGKYHKSTYSRTLSGKFINANPEVVYHLRRAIDKGETTKARATAAAPTQRDTKRRDQARKRAK